MTQSKLADAGLTVKLLSVLVAALLWVSVMMERPGETKLLVPVRPERVPAGLSLASPPPAVEITVSGPRILLLMLPLRELACALDLAGASAGTAQYRPRSESVRMPDRDLQVVSVTPAAVSLTLSKQSTK